MCRLNITVKSIKHELGWSTTPSNKFRTLWRNIKQEVNACRYDSSKGLYEQGNNNRIWVNVSSGNQNNHQVEQLTHTILLKNKYKVHGCHEFNS